MSWFGLVTIADLLFVTFINCLSGRCSVRAFHTALVLSQMGLAVTLPKKPFHFRGKAAQLTQCYP